MNPLLLKSVSLLLPIGALSLFVYVLSKQTDAPAADVSPDAPDISVNQDDLTTPDVVSALGLGYDPPSLFNTTDTNLPPILNTLGFRNNNPGNIKYITTSPFRGQIGQNAGFGVYDTVGNGVRAIGMQLQRYFNIGIDTVEGIITRYSSTDQMAYIRNVSEALRVGATDHILLPAYRDELVAAIIKQENGSNPFTLAQIAQWCES